MAPEGPRRARVDVRRWARHQLPRRRLQPFFERLHGWSLVGMGIGSAVWPLDESGEAVFVAAFGTWARASGVRPVVCLDVGANAGGYGELLADSLGDDGIVHCFEPAASTFDRLQDHLGGRASVSLHRTALGPVDGEAMLYTLDGHPHLSSLYALPGERTETVDVRTVDAWAVEHGIDHVSLLKVDVEGAELDVLRGASGFLERGRIDVVQFEYGERSRLGGATLGDFYELLGDDYLIHRMVIDGLFPLPTSRACLDHTESATNYVAVRRPLVGSFPLGRC